MGGKRGFRRLSSHRRAQGHEARVFWLVDEAIVESYPSIESGIDFATSVMAPRTVASMESLLTVMALRSGLFATGDSVEADRVRFLKN